VHYKKKAPKTAMAATIAGPPTVKRDAAELSTRVADERGELVVEETA